MKLTRKLSGFLAALIFGCLGTVALSPAFATDGESVHKLDLWQPGDVGKRLLLRGRVSTETGMPIPDAKLYFRQADGTGAYSDQYQGTLRTNAEGSYALGSVIPGLQDHSKEIHVYVTHADYSVVDTSISFKNDSALQLSDIGGNAIVVEEATVDGATVYLGEFNIVLPHESSSCAY